MEYKRIPLKQSLYLLTKSNEIRNIYRLWADDGWCYIPQLKKRERFTETHFFSENWDGIIPIPLYSEQVLQYVYSPLVWREFDDLYEVTNSNQTN